MNQSKMVVFLQDNKFMGFAEPAGADYIIACAVKAGFEVEMDDDYFNVVLATANPKQLVAATVKN